MCSAHCLTERNIWVKFNENHTKSSGDMERTQNSIVNPLTVTMSPGSWVVCSVLSVSMRGAFQ